MTLNEYQHEASKTDHHTKIGDSKLPYIALGLNGEAGEVADIVKKMFRDDGGKLTPERRCALILEGGDCLWYLAALCRALGITLEEMAELNLDKLADRAKRNAIGGDGDNR